MSGSLCSLNVPITLSVTRASRSVVNIPADRSRWPNAGLMLGQRRRRWASISPALGRRLVFAGYNSGSASQYSADEKKHRARCRTFIRSSENDSCFAFCLHLIVTLIIYITIINAFYSTMTILGRWSNFFSKKSTQFRSEVST